MKENIRKCDFKFDTLRVGMKAIKYRTVVSRCTVIFKWFNNFDTDIKHLMGNELYKTYPNKIQEAACKWLNANTQIWKPHAWIEEIHLIVGLQQNDALQR